MTKFEQIIQQVLSSGKRDYKVICPFHTTQHRDGSFGPEKTGSCSVNIDKHVFYCFGCGEKGSFVKFKALLDGESWEDAKRNIYQGEVPDYLIRQFQEEEEEDYLYPDYKLAYLAARGEIEARDIHEYESNMYGLLKDKEDNTYIPIKDMQGKLRGCQVRYENKDYRYGYILPTNRGKYFFGEHLLNIKNDIRLIICEGALDCVKLFGVLQVPVLAHMGSNLSPKQVETLNKLPLKEITLWSDNDITGRNSLLNNYNRLKKKLAIPINGIEFTDTDAKDPCAEKEERIKEQYHKRKWVPMLKV